MNTINGLPVHVLLVHAIVVLMPLSALLSGATLTKPATARRVWLAPTSTRVTRVIAALAVLVALTTLYDVYRIGDSGAKASWDGKVTSAPYLGG